MLLSQVEESPSVDLCTSSVDRKSDVPPVKTQFEEHYQQTIPAVPDEPDSISISFFVVSIDIKLTQNQQEATIIPIDSAE